MQKINVAICPDLNKPDELTSGVLENAYLYEIGDIVEISLHDENGNFISATGRLVEFLD